MIRQGLQLSKVHATTISAKQNGPIREPLWNGAGQLLTYNKMLGYGRGGGVDLP